VELNHWNNFWTEWSWYW